MENVLGALTGINWTWILWGVVIIFILWKAFSKKKTVELPIINTREIVRVENIETAKQLLKALGTRTHKQVYINGYNVGTAFRELRLKWRAKEDDPEKEYILLEVKRALLGPTRYYLLDLDAIEYLNDAIIIRATMDEMAGIYYTVTRTEGTSTRDVIIDWSYKRILEGELGAMEELAKHVATYHDTLMAAELFKTELYADALREGRETKKGKAALGL